MIDPITSLASSIVASPGVYALLLGSGVSRAAGIPTGWEVTIDLIRRIAAGEGEDDIATASATDVEEWFRERFKEEASYSNVLEHLALGPGDRRNLLSSYFERGPDDAEGFKTPTRAHHAIASLVASGYIKVIVTTNFDRLLEDALAAKGVRAQVIFSPDHIRGATPLEHAKVTILKLHGDYQDNRIRNTVDELDAYEPKLEKYLRGILEDYGLLVCGWSGDWDRALVRVLQKTVSRRYGFYMTFRSTPSAIANELIEFRGGRLIEIEDADTFFAALEEKVLSIEKLGRRDPISADLAQISLKRYLPRPELGIELEELVRTHLNDLRDRHAQWRGQGNALDAYLEELEELAAIAEVCLRLIITGAYYGSPEHNRLWHLMIDRVLNHPHLAWSLSEPDLHRVPAVLLVYGFVAGVVARGDLERVPKVLDRVRIRTDSLSRQGYQAFHPPHAIRETWLKERYTTGSTKESHLVHYAWVGKTVGPHLTWLVPEGRELDALLDETEYVLTLLTAVRPENGRIPGWAPIGRFCVGFPSHSEVWDTSDHVAARYERRIADEGSDFPLVWATGVTLEEFKAAKEVIDRQSETLTWGYFL